MAYQGGVDAPQVPQRVGHVSPLVRETMANDMPHDAGYRCRVSRGLEGFSPDPLTDLLRRGARQLIAQAVEAELNGCLAAHADQTDGAGRRRLVRHGHLPEREVQTGIGAVPPLGQCFALACRAGEGAPGAGMRRVRKPSGGWFSRRMHRGMCR